MKNKYMEIVVVYLLFAILIPACAVVQPALPVADGDVLNLFPYTTNWIAHEGDILVHTFQSSNGLIVHTRPLAGGWAVTCEMQACPDVVKGYLMNSKTYNDLIYHLTTYGGFIEIVRALPSIPVPTLFIVPAALLTPAQTGDIFGFLREDG